MSLPVIGQGMSVFKWLAVNRWSLSATFRVLQASLFSFLLKRECEGSWYSSKRLSLQWFTTHINLSILHSLQICRWTKTDKNVPHWKMYVATSLQALSALVHLLICKLCSILWYTGVVIIVNLVLWRCVISPSDQYQHKDTQYLHLFLSAWGIWCFELLLEVFGAGLLGELEL